jgi:hypothetical protein
MKGWDWKTFPDLPHYQLKLGQPVAQVRELLETGQPAQAFAQTDPPCSWASATAYIWPTISFRGLGVSSVEP